MDRSPAPGAEPYPALSRWRVPMTGRDPSEPHRAVTPLELLFDLCFVVAVAQSAGALHHDVADGHLADGIVAYIIVFFAVWWPWMNFTWFASAYDTDDVPYRLLTFVQIIGVLVVAAGVPRVHESLDFSIVVTGYVIMRAALVALWLRAARGDPARRAVALRYALGIGVIQVIWVLRLALDPVGVAPIFVLGLVELLIPLWAERAGPALPWHPAHITERYGLFTIIVLGECIFAATTAIQGALDEAGVSVGLIAVSLGGLLLVFATWWSYFKPSTTISQETTLAWRLAWGYGHYFVFAAIAALGAGLQVAADAIVAPARVSPVTAAMMVAVPAVVYLVAIAVLHRDRRTGGELTSLAVAVPLVLVAAAAAGIVGVPVAILAIGVLLGLLVWNVAPWRIQGSSGSLTGA